MRMAADTASDRNISGDVREVFILVDPLRHVGADGKRFIASAITAMRAGAHAAFVIDASTASHRERPSPSGD
jgi:hypothetical protein